MNGWSLPKVTGQCHKVMVKHEIMRYKCFAHNSWTVGWIFIKLTYTININEVEANPSSKSQNYGKTRMNEISFAYKSSMEPSIFTRLANMIDIDKKLKLTHDKGSKVKVE